MQIQNTFSPSDLSQLKRDVNHYNKHANVTRTGKNSNMGKNEFLKLLTVQLSKQDPLSPMKNTEFISQMAQFSALEQMTKVNRSVNSMVTQMNKGHAQSLVGKHVSFVNGATGQPGNGNVQEVWFNQDSIRLMVNGKAISYEDITRVKAGHVNLKQ